MGRMMREKGYAPDLILCSSAARTRETWENAAPELRAESQTKFLDALYDASVGTILNCLQHADDAAASLLYIGHNPGLEQLARMLVREPQGGDERRKAVALMSKYPTGALTIIDLPVDHWAEIAPGDGTLIDFVAPADLKSK